MERHTLARSARAALLAVACATFAFETLRNTPVAAAEKAEPSEHAQANGVVTTGAMGITETVDQIMAKEKDFAAWDPSMGYRIFGEHEDIAFKKRKKQSANALPVSSWPVTAKSVATMLSGSGANSHREGGEGENGATGHHGSAPHLPQGLGFSFTGNTITTDGGVLPPDTMGAVGPTQVMVTTNGRIRVYDKTTGALGALNATQESFFSSVLGGGSNFCSDPQVRYDRTSGRWIIITLSIPPSFSANRVLVAVSSGSTITGSGSFTFFFFTAAASGELCDYPSLGVDANALYIGGNIFNSAGTSLLRADGWVVRKSSVTGAGPIVQTKFQVMTGAGVGLFSPRGVDNDDATATQGYFIGVDGAQFSVLKLRRVSTPGGTPTMSGDLSVSVPTTGYPQNVTPQGSSTSLDAL
ncbi:MAG TPA: hypothetical protein VG711_10050, partial [Phycisphaerales bacterium]|nr:hypothetical protein [Phycisphaerales bacterium]